MEASGAVPPVKGGLNSEVRAIVAAHGGISADTSTPDDQANLFRAGLSSHASVNVMLALEDAFDVEFPITCSRAACSRAWKPSSKPSLGWPSPAPRSDIDR